MALVGDGAALLAARPRLDYAAVTLTGMAVIGTGAALVDGRRVLVGATVIGFGGAFVVRGVAMLVGRHGVGFAALISLSRSSVVLICSVIPPGHVGLSRYHLRSALGRRFAARLPGLTFDLALSVRPAGAHGSGGRRSAVPGAARITSRPGAWSTSGPQNTVPLDDYRRVRGSDNPSSLQGLSMVVHASGWVSLLLYVLLYEADV